MPTTAQITAERKRLRREAEQTARKRDRGKLRELRGHLAHAKKLKSARAREVVIACKHARARVVAARKAARARYLHEVAIARERNRLASRSKCDGRKAKVRAENASRIDRALRALAAERTHQGAMKTWANPAPLKHKQHKRRGDSLQESNSEVEHNIPQDLLPVWRAVRGKIKATPRRSRTEAFLEWVHDHGSAVRRILDQQIERDVAELVKHERALRKRVGSPRTYRRMTETQLADVPF
jgi:hypothetical protein